MHTTYNFHFLNTVSRQLVAKLDELPVSVLDPDTLSELGLFQEVNNAKQGVYLLHYEGSPVYLGKAEDVRERLAQHLTKLTGRQNIQLTDIGYKAILLDRSMSTAANETVLIGFFRQNHVGMWNNRGFGPKDPGRQRDNTRPSYFDQMYPIRDDYPVTFDDNSAKLGDLLLAIKAQVPYVFRYSIVGQESLDVDLANIPRALSSQIAAKDLLQLAVTRLGAGWKGVVLSHGMVLYCTTSEYEFGRELLP